MRCLAPTEKCDEKLEGEDEELEPMLMQEIVSADEGSVASPFIPFDVQLVPEVLPTQGKVWLVGDSEGVPSTRMDMLFVDVDSKDPSLSMSAPPPSFVTTEALKIMYNVLKPGGVLVLNVVSEFTMLCSAVLVFA